MGRNVEATYEGKSYSIPEMWLAVNMPRYNMTIVDAVAWWAYLKGLDEVSAAVAA